MSNQLKNIKLHVVCIPDMEDEIKKIFFNSLEDYCKRFNVKCTEDKVSINLCFMEYPDPYEYDFKNGTSHGVTIHDSNAKNRKIIVQVRDPFLNEWESNYYMMQQFLQVMCHEFVHVFQYLTGRNGIKIKINYDKENNVEEYLFDPSEVEARLFEMVYLTLFCNKLL